MAAKLCVLPIVTLKFADIHREPLPRAMEQGIAETLKKKAEQQMKEAELFSDLANILSIIIVPPLGNT